MKDLYFKKYSSIDLDVIDFGKGTSKGGQRSNCRCNKEKKKKKRIFIIIFTTYEE